MVWRKGIPKTEKERKGICKGHRRRSPKREQARRAAISKALRGKTFSQERKDNLRKALTGRRLSESHVKAFIASRTGKPLSKAHRETLSKARNEHLDTHSDLCPCVWGPDRTSRLSEQMINVFLVDFPEVIAEKRFGRYTVDAYLPPPYHLAFEADGTYWHGRPGNKERDAERDANLLERFKLPVVRLTQVEIEDSF